MISEQDNEQDKRIAVVEANQTALGRSIDGVRELTIRTGDEIKADFHNHEDTCRENWRDQKEFNGSAKQQLKIILWVLATAVGIGASIVAEHFWGIWVDG